MEDKQKEIMTNEEKARECSSTQIRHIKDEFHELDNYLLNVIEAEAIVQNLQMAEWKDNQLREYLEKKISKNNIDKLAVEYENHMYGYSVNIENDMETDASNQQNIIDIHDAFIAGYNKAKEIISK